MKDIDQTQVQRPLKELPSHDPDRVVQQIYQLWGSWQVGSDSLEMMEGIVIEETKLFTLQETHIGVMKLFCTHLAIS